jgi:torulene dioxygenase
MASNEITTATIGIEDVKHFGDFPNDIGFSDIPETRTPVELKVTGTIPNYVHGSLYRTGPGSYTTPLKNGGIFRIQHWYVLKCRLYR